MNGFRIGLGMDSHRLAPGGPLILGGVRLEFDMHFVGHSDADVLLHAITDAILSGAGLADIGELFPNTAPENRGRDSADMLSHAMSGVREKGWTIVNLDCVVQLEKPKISSHKNAIRNRIASILGISVDQVSVKGKTGEGIGEIGRGELGAATCVVLLSQGLSSNQPLGH
ncbi:MAG: 2-C-methyl-D-erythritol 2,4-cyclodiphosphate synthase [Pirellula sp.]